MMLEKLLFHNLASVDRSLSLHQFATGKGGVDIHSCRSPTLQILLVALYINAESKSVGINCLIVEVITPEATALRAAYYSYYRFVGCLSQR